MANRDARLDEAMSDARLREIRKGIEFNQMGMDEDEALFAISDLLAEVERLRAALAAQGKLVALIAAEAWHGHDAPHYAGIRRLMEAHKRDWHTLPETNANKG